MYSSFHTVTNPYSFEANGATCVATSGQNIDSMYQFTNEQDRVQLTETTLQCSHLAPLAPDSLWCHPFKDDDPFILETMPHIYVVGNQPEYSSKLYQDGQNNRCRIVLLPKFSKSGVMAMVNTQTLQVRKVAFGDPSMYSK
jgi:DNA polymerase delta subunit 2